MVVQERNSLGGTSYEPRVLRAILTGRSLAVKAVTAAQLSMAADGVYSVTLDEAIEAMRLTAADMSVKYKETSLSVRFVFARFLLQVTDVHSIGSRGTHTLHYYISGTCTESLCRQPSRYLSRSLPARFFIHSVYSLIYFNNPQSAEVLPALVPQISARSCGTSQTLI